MQDEPTPTELLKAVADFLRNEITPAGTVDLTLPGRQPALGH